MKTSAIIVAAGAGSRLGLQTPKAFVQIAGASLLLHSLRVIGELATVNEAIIAVPVGMEPTARMEAQAAGLRIPVKITPGGEQRQDSVRLALALTSAESDLVIVHDAARPFATRALFETCLAEAARCGAAITAIPVADTLKRVQDGIIIATEPRAGLWQAQTPQVFRRELLLLAHQQQSQGEPVAATDDAELVQLAGAKIAVVEGSAFNLKITTPDDLKMGEAMAKELLPR